MTGNGVKGFMMYRPEDVSPARGQPSRPPFRLIGGALCLDFANTIEGRDGARAKESLHEYGDVLRWAKKAGSMPAHAELRIASDVAGQGSAFLRAIEAREAIYAVFTAIGEGEKPPVDSLVMLRDRYIDGVSRARLTERDGHYRWTWDDGPELHPDRPLWPILVSAIDLLERGPLERIKRCPGGGPEPCNWLFLDTTRSGTRRWCSMDDCGAARKWRNQNARRRAQSAHRSPERTASRGTE